ncbi:MAG: alpha/beta hydrolase [Deltaproteobacteria bacterium]|nr:alpha/beta hydrolase [Deltaproteobacteria bacterium]
MWYYILIAILVYLVLTIFFTYLVHQIPRAPVNEPPNWGHTTDTRIPAIDGGELEVWRIEPEGISRGVVVLVHGWSRNRDRMVPRASIFGQMGFTTIIHSARDHGRSSRHRFMNAFRFAEDVEAVLNWIDEPVILYGHSVGAAGAIIAASRNPERIKLLFLEACYARTREALRSLYRSHNLFFGLVFGPMVVFWMDIFYRFRLDEVSPALLAPLIDIPVLIIHGEKDRSFPLHHALRLRDSFPGGNAELFVGKGAGHSSSSLTNEYPGVIKTFVNRHLPNKP